MSKSKHHPAELIIVGKGPIEKFLVELVKKLGIQDHVKICGGVTQEEKWLHYLTSTAVVLASKFEGMPRVIFEAFAAGKIVIVPNICGLAEVVQDGTNGFLFNSDEEFLSILRFVNSNVQQISEMQKTSAESTLEKFNLNANKGELYSLFREVQTGS